ncbi:DUF1491 family protein [Propylenella binzhouense]|uniref:DUF1491 family protein n=1 Tax=Propylenella binzhouense TaxID=2555902 RepID=A0A964T8L8_9HYPH|nr:DUF1491 family protein [Propylenella binzhouense]MYZ50484.1 DUF1491 family protein [Propylenella binzhouense]
MRLRSDFWVAALRRRAEADGAFVHIARKGAAEAGAIFILVNRLDGSLDLYGPAPQAAMAEAEAGDRKFSLVAAGLDEARAAERIRSEAKFDSDLWVVEIEDRAGRVFADTVAI